MLKETPVPLEEIVDSTITPKDSAKKTAAQPVVNSPQPPTSKPLPDPRIARQTQLAEQALSEGKAKEAENAINNLRTFSPQSPLLSNFQKRLSELELQLKQAEKERLAQKVAKEKARKVAEERAKEEARIAVQAQELLQQQKEAERLRLEINA